MLLRLFLLFLNPVANVVAAIASAATAAGDVATVGVAAVVVDSVIDLTVQGPVTVVDVAASVTNDNNANAISVAGMMLLLLPILLKQALRKYSGETEDKSVKHC